METRTLGRGLEVSALGFGCMGLNFAYGTAIDRQDAISLVRSVIAWSLPRSSASRSSPAGIAG